MTSDNIGIKTNMLNPSQEHPESSKAPKLDLKEKWNSLYLWNQLRLQNSEYLCIKDQRPYQIKVKIPHPSQEPKAFSKVTD